MPRASRNAFALATRATKLLALLDRNRHDHPPHVNHIYKVFIRCEILGGSPTTSHEIQGVGFFAEDEIPELSLTRKVPRIVRGIVLLSFRTLNVLQECLHFRAEFVTH